MELIYISLVHAVSTAVNSYVWLPCCIQKILFPCGPHCLRLLGSSCTLFHNNPQVLGEGNVIWASHFGLSILVFYSLNLEQLWVSVFAIYCKQHFSEGS